MIRAVTAVLVLPLAVVAGCGTTETARRPSAARLASVNRVAVVAQGASAFEVVAGRAKAGAVLPYPVGAGGGIGGAVAGLAILTFSLAATAVIKGTAASRDASDASTLGAQVAGLSPGAVLVDTFTRTLRSGGRFEVEVLETEPKGEQRRRFDAIVLLRFPTWGFQLLRQDEPFLAAFVEVDARMILAARNESLWEQAETASGRGRQTLEELKADPELMRRELTDTLETAGYRLAVELLYPRGRER